MKDWALDQDPDASLFKTLALCMSASIWKCWELLLTVWKLLLISTQYFYVFFYYSNISKAHFLKIRGGVGELPRKLPQLCAGFSTLLEDKSKNVCKHYEESFCSEDTYFWKCCHFVVVVWLVFFFQVLKVLLPFLISHTLHSANTQAFLLHLFTKANHNMFVSVGD